MSELEEIKKALWDLAGKHEYKWRCLLLAAWNLICAVEDQGLSYALEKMRTAKQYVELAENAVKQELEDISEMWGVMYTAEGMDREI